MNLTWLYLAVVYAAAVALARRAGAELPKRIAFFFYALVLLFFFKPLTGPYVNFQLDVLPSLPPWYHVTQYHYQYTSELNDLPMQIVPWMHQVRESWKSLTPPLWNPYAGSGYPLLGNGQSAALSLLHFLTLPLSLGHAVSAEGAMKILIALTFTFLYCRRRYSMLGSTIAAVTFGFAGFLTGWLHFPMATAACLAPAVLYAIDLLAERRSYGRFLFAALLWTQLLFAGHPETAAHLFWLGAVYTLWLILGEKQSWRLLVTLGGALTVSALLAAPYLGPLVETMAQSKRVAELKEVPYDAKFLPYQDKSCAIVMFQPHYFGRVPWEKAWGPADTEPLGGFPGMFGWIAWIATGLTALAYRQWRSRELFFALTTLFIVGVIFAWPVIGDSFHLMMPIAAHARARMLFTLLCAIQAAAAIDLARRVPMLTAILAAAFVLFALLRMPFASAYRFDTAVFGMLPGIVTLIAAAIYTVTRHKAAAMALLVVVIAELFHFGRDRSTPLPERMLYPKTPLIAKLQQLRAQTKEPYRFAGIGAQFFPNLSTIYGIEDIRAHDPMANARYLAFLRLTADYEPWNYFAFLNDANKPVFDFLNVRWVVVEPGTVVSDPARYAVVYDGRDGKILENRNVLPRFYGVRAVREVFYPHIREHRDWGDVAFANVKVNGVANTTLVNASPTSYRLNVDATDRALVVSSIPRWPGWKVSVDGKRIDPVEVNAVFLGFVVPKGAHDVRVWYSPMSFRVGAWIALLTVIGISYSAVRARRYPRAPAR